MGSVTYGYTGQWVIFTPPTGVLEFTVDVQGGGNGTARGGRVTGVVRISAGEKLAVAVGRGSFPHVGSSGGGTVNGGGGGPGGDGVSALGGDSGAGCSHLRLGYSQGTILACGGGAGGNSGDGGLGAPGGSPVGSGAGTIAQDGKPGNAGPNLSTGGQGGQPTQGGNGGQSPVSNAFDGGNASDALVSFGGYGGTTDGRPGPGGGGGGGGIHMGGGGAAGLAGYSSGSGGGAGCNYTYPLGSPTSQVGAGGLNNGQITISWVDEGGHPIPNTPTDVSPTDGTATKSTGSVVVSAVPTVTGGGLGMHIKVLYSTDSNFSTYQSVLSPSVKSGDTASVTLTGLSQDTEYFVRVYSWDVYAQSVGYNSTSFFTNRAPTEPTLLTPNPGQQFTTLDSIKFSWTHNDPDPDSPQAAAQVRWHEDNGDPNAPYTTQTISSSFASIIENPGLFKSNTFYLWSVRTEDQQGRWGPWAPEERFFVSGTSSPPIPVSPVKAEALDIADPVTFSWRFVDPDPGDTQSRADVRWRPKGGTDMDWVQNFGDTTTPGHQTSWTFPIGNFQPGVQYEWQVRTYDTLSGGSGPSDWSASAFFWTVFAPGSEGGAPIVPPDFVPLGSLGCGTNRVFVYDRGGKKRIGEITQITQGQWGRVRDDMSAASLTTVGFDTDCGQLLSQLRSWRHELVIFRNGSRVWEGPITRIEYGTDYVTIDAKDVMAWPYRRIMRQGYSDAYPSNLSVVKRAYRVLVNALAPDDPNVLPYLTAIEYPDDAVESRVKADYSSTAFEEVDDMAANAGLDYVVVGRRIVLFDTHRSIGKLPMMRDGDFDSPPIVTEYGMNLAVRYGVTNGTGIWGAANAPVAQQQYYGLVELLSTAYGETDQQAADEATLTPAAQAALARTFGTQAQRNILYRFPAPVIVHVPDNSTLNPEVAIDINYLVPGVWVPVQATNTLRNVTQWQKLDSMTCSWDTSGEKVQVVMSPAPGGGNDPDADLGVETE